MHTVVETPTFLRQADKHGLTEREREALVSFVAGDPEAGDLIRRSGGCRKLRFAGKGKGKSGGFRVITFCSGESMPVFLLTVYAKGKLSTLNDAQVNMLNVFTRALVGEYRK